MASMDVTHTQSSGRRRWHRPRRLATTFGIMLCMSSGGLTKLAGTSGSQLPVSDATQGDTTGQTKLWREGSRIEEQTCVFRASGDRLTIELPESTSPITVLENLAAQRIHKAVQEDSQDNYWIIHGTMTEFNDENFIIIERAQRTGGK